MLSVGVRLESEAKLLRLDQRSFSTNSRVNSFCMLMLGVLECNLSRKYIKLSHVTFYLKESKKPSPYKVLEDLLRKETKSSRIRGLSLICCLLGLGVPLK